MDFLEIANNRQSCRKYITDKVVEQEKIDKIIEAAILAPSACNSQPYHITVCRGDTAKKVAKATMSVGLNGFANEAPVLLVISEKPYNKSAAIGAKLKNNDYRSIDIGILSAYITAEATALGISNCILGWVDSGKIGEICGVDGTVRLVITLGYTEDETVRPKRRKDLSDLVTYIDE